MKIEYKQFECNNCGIVIAEDESDFNQLDYHRTTDSGHYARCINCKQEGSMNTNFVEYKC